MTTQRLLLAEPPDSSIPTAAPELRETFRVLDVVGSGWIVVLSFSTTAPPSTPQQGDAYLCPAGATGAWAGHQNHLAIFTPVGWIFRSPRYGWIAVIADQNLPYGRVLQYTGTEWTGWILPASQVSFDTTGTDFTSTTLEELMQEINLRFLADESTIDDHTSELADHEMRIDALEAAGGGGSGGGGSLTPDTEPTLANALDDEFNGSSLDSKWTITRGTLTTTQVARGALYIVDNSTSADNIAGYGQAVSGNFKIRAKFWLTGEGVDNRGGIYVARGGNKFMVFGLFNNSGTFNWYVNKMTAVTGTGVSNLFVAGSGVSNGLQRGAGPFYAQIEYDGTNVKFYGALVGYDGYFDASIGSEAVATFLGGAPDEVGVYCDRGNANGHGVLFDWFRGGF